MLGGAIAYFGTKKGISIMTETTEDSVETIKKDLNAAHTYRFVRYLPEYLWIGWSNADYSLNPGFTSQNQQKLIHPTWITNETQSFVSFMPDIDSRKNSFALFQASWKSWKSQVEAYLSDSTHLVFWEKLAGSADQLMKLAHSNAFAINLEFTGTNHRLEINSQGITGTIQGGLFAQGPTYGIDLMNRTITAERAAMDSIIKLPPPLFVSNIFNEINKQIYNLKHRK
jgi:hypothetical protein